MFKISNYIILYREDVEYKIRGKNKTQKELENMRTGK